MTSTYDTLLARLQLAFDVLEPGADPVLRTSDRSDFQSNGVMSLAKRLGRPPRDVAEEIVGRLVALGGSRLVMRAMGPYWKEAPISDDKIKLVAELWNRIGAIAKSSGVAASMHIDFLCGFREEEHMEKLLQWTDPDAVGLTLDTAELTIAGLDPVAVYRKHHARINHVHFKDAITTDTLDEYKDENAEMEYWPVNLVMAGVKRDVSRWYYEMGTPGGLVDFPALLAAMNAQGYDGWVIVESDQSPHVEESVMLNGWYKKRLVRAQP